MFIGLVLAGLGFGRTVSERREGVWWSDKCLGSAGEEVNEKGIKYYSDLVSSLTGHNLRMLISSF
jgi:beta-glucosidase/6-phospho-beta-glucosidase/beta-galactosidase